MNTRELVAPMVTLMTELVSGSPDVTRGTFMLNRGDPGLLQSIERLSAVDASHCSNGGASIAAHVDHLRYGLALLNRWAAGEDQPWKNADWTQSWKLGPLDEATWRSLVGDLRREAERWIAALGTPRDLEPDELNWTVGSIPHLAYHLGAIRQIDRAARGPTAEEEKASQQR